MLQYITNPNTFPLTKFLLKCLLNLIFTERPYINKIINEKFNKPIESNPDLSKFDIDICHLCNEKIEDNPVRNSCHYTKKCKVMLIMNVIYNINLKR